MLSRLVTFLVGPAPTDIDEPEPRVFWLWVRTQKPLFPQYRPVWPGRRALPHASYLLGDRLDLKVGSVLITLPWGRYVFGGKRVARLGCSRDGYWLEIHADSYRKSLQELCQKFAELAGHPIVVRPLPAVQYGCGCPLLEDHASRYHGDDDPTALAKQNAVTSLFT